MRWHTATFRLLISLFILHGPCAAQDSATTALRAFEAVAKRPANEEALLAYLATLPQVTLGFGHLRKNYYLLEGDLKMTAREVSIHIRLLGSDPCEAAAKLAASDQLNSLAVERCLEATKKPINIKGEPLHIFFMTRHAVEALHAHAPQALQHSLISGSRMNVPTSFNELLQDLASVRHGNTTAYAVTVTRENVPFVLRANGSTLAGGQLGTIRELAVNTLNGEPTYWHKDYRTLRYAVIRSTFPDEPAYEMAVTDIFGAARDWEELCSHCGVKFVHKRKEYDGIRFAEELHDAINLDAQSNADGLRFSVMFAPRGLGSAVATAFFPTAPGEERVLWLSPNYFSLANKQVRRGVVRHELGHVLGYRHEHITADVRHCLKEDAKYRPLTPYDRKSVMHYFCGETGIREFTFTELDREGHALAYGNK